MRIILYTLLLLSPFVAFGQSHTSVDQGATLYRYKNGLKVDSALFLPRKDTTTTDTSMRAPGMLVYRLIDSLLYWRKGNKMTPIASGTGNLGDFYTKSQADNRFVHYTDTALMLLPYLRKIDTAAMLRSYLRKTDTSTMLSPYLRRVDTTAMLSPYLRKIDTTGMLAEYYTKSQLQTSGQSSVNWNNITNVPASFPTNSNLQTVTNNGALTTNAITINSTASDALTIKQNGTGDFALRFSDNSNAVYGRLGDVGTANTFELASNNRPLAITSPGVHPVQIRVNDSLILNLDDTLATFNTVVAGIDPKASNQFVTVNYFDTSFITKLWTTPMTPLMTQPALPPQPTDPIPVVTGKLTALYNSISGTYIENQKTTDQVADMRIAGDVQASGVGVFGGWYTSGLQGPINHIGVTGGVAQLMAFNRTTSAYFPLSINASSTAINGGSSGNVAIRKSSPTFNLDVTGTTRIEGANYKLFLDRSAMATQDNIIALRSPGLNTSTDTIGYFGNASRTTNDIFLLARQADLIFRLPVNNTLHFGTHIDGNGTSRKDVTTMRNGKWLWADSITTTPLYPIHVINTQDTSIFTAHKVVAGGVESSGAISTPFLGTAITTSTALNDTHHTVRVTTSGITLTFPAASSRPGREFYIVNHSAGTINISPNYINLAGASASVVAANSAFIFQSDGTNWYLIK